MTIKGNTEEALAFLAKWPTPTIQLTAIHVDPTTKEKGLIEARTFNKDEQSAIYKWVEERQGRANLYFTVNALTAPKDKKALKTDIATMVACHVDIDVPAGEDQEATAAKLLESVQAYKFEPSVITSSGGGVQAFWILQPGDYVPIDGDVAKAEAAECLNRQIEADFANVRGAKADACHNVDRIMRLPGTINVPDKRKVEKGRVPALARLVSFSDLRYPVGAFTPAAPKNAVTASGVSGSRASNGRVKVEIDWEEARALYRTIDLAQLRARGVQEHALLSLEFGDNLLRLHERHTAIGHRVAEGAYDSYNPLTLSIATALLKAGLTFEECAAVMSDPATPGNKHVTKQKDDTAKHRAVERALGKAQHDIEAQDKRAAADALGMPRWVETYDPDGLKPMPTMRNARLAIEGLGVKIAHDLFHDRTIITYQGESIPLLECAGPFTDNKLVRLRTLICERFAMDPQEKPLFDACKSLAMEHAFDPVLDYLDACEAKWDKVPRLFKMAVVYLGAIDTVLNCEMMARQMIGAVARARVPGAKHDNILVFEGKEGTGKSTAIAILFGKDNFTDQRILGCSDKEAAELVMGRWGIELSDLAGMVRAEVEASKAFFSRDTDRIRPAYGRVVIEVPRRFVVFGTTNNDNYLQSQTGNRRFWPLLTGIINLVKLAEDRDQLWAEACVLWRNGAKNELDESLWGAAEEAQEERRAVDPWEDLLANIPLRVPVRLAGVHGQLIQVVNTHENGRSGGVAQTEERIASAVILEQVLGVPPHQAQSFHYARMATVLRRLGWLKPPGSGTLRVGKDKVRGWWRPAIERPAEEPGPKAPGPEAIPF